MNTQDLSLLYEQFFYNSLETLVLLNIEENRFVLCNENVYNLYGYTVEEFLSITPYDLSSVYRDNYSMENKQEEILEKEYDKFITKHKKKDGTILDIYVKSKKIIFNNTKYLFISLTDINSELTLRKYFLEKQFEMTRFFTISKIYKWDIYSQELYENNHKIPLTPKETFLIHILIENIDTVVSKYELETLTKDHKMTTQSIVAMIKRIRLKLDTPLIQTIYGSGYMIKKTFSGLKAN